MGLLNLFKRKPLITDRDFGEMRFHDDKKEELRIFEATGFFIPLQINVGYCIPADESGPTDQQRSFLHFLNENYNSLTEKAKPLIINEFSNWKEDFKIEDFNKEFIPESISLPRFTGEALQWEICFTTIHDPNHWVMIYFTDFVATGILIDG